MTSLPDGSFGREYLRFLEDNVGDWEKTALVFVFIAQHGFPYIKYASPKLCSFSFVYSRASACDPWLKGRREVRGQRGACLCHAAIQGGPWFAAHVAGHAHQHAGWDTITIPQNSDGSLVNKQFNYPLSLCNKEELKSIFCNRVSPQSFTSEILGWLVILTLRALDNSFSFPRCCFQARWQWNGLKLLRLDFPCVLLAPYWGHLGWIQGREPFPRVQQNTAAQRHLELSQVLYDMNESGIKHP